MEIIREEKAGLSGKARCINFRISLQKSDMFPDGSSFLRMRDRFV